MPHLDTPALRDVTPRLAAVLARVELGRTQAEIASDLGVAPSTIHSHIARLEMLFEVGSMTELGRCWATNKWDWLLLMARPAGAEDELTRRLVRRKSHRRVDKIRPARGSKPNR